MGPTDTASDFLDRLLGAEQPTEDDAQQFGVKGMRWGVRKPAGAPPGPASEVAVKTRPGKKVKTAGGKERAPSEDAINAAVGKQVAKRSSTDALSNKELQAVVTRMQLEANYKRLSKENQSAGKKFITQMLTNKQQRDGAINYAKPIKEVITAPIGVGRDIKRTDLSDIGK